MAAFVADASATLPWCFEEEATPATEALLERLRAGEPAVVPAHWPTEVMNGLIMAVRRSRIDLERVARFARDLAALPIRIEVGVHTLGRHLEPAGEQTTRHGSGREFISGRLGGAIGGREHGYCRRARGRQWC